MTVLGIFQFLRRHTGAIGAPTTLRSGQPFVNEVENVLYMGVGDDGTGASTSQLAMGGAGAFATRAYTSKQGAKRDVFDKLSDVPSIKDYGALGTGSVGAANTNNDGPAFTAFLNDASALTCRVPSGVYVLPAGFYLGTKTFVFETGAVLVKPDGSTSDAVMYGGIQVGAGLSGAASNGRSATAATAKSLFGTTKYEGGDNLDNGQPSAPLTGDTYFYSGRCVSGYSAVPLVHYYGLVYGTARPASGSACLTNGSIQIGGVQDTSSNGSRSEFNPWSAGAVCLSGYDQYNVNVYFDAVVSGPISQPASALHGLISHVQRRNPSVNATFNNGHTAGVCSTAPGGAGYTDGTTAQAATTPLEKMHTVCGFSGSSTAGIVTGAATNADFAATYGYFAGGASGVWLPSSARSKFQYAIGAQDWTDAGLSIKNRHPAGVGPGISSDYFIAAPNITFDPNYYCGFLGPNPAIVLDSTPSLMYYDRTALNFNFVISNGTVLRIAAGAITPGTTDNTVNLGSGSNRFATVFAGTGTINTSDATQKVNFKDVDEGLLLASLDTPQSMWQWQDAVSLKGPDKARWHFGPTAQGFRDACLARGYDPTRFAGFCADPEYRNASKTRTVTQPVVDEVDDSEPTDETYLDADGTAKRRTITKKVKRARFSVHPVMDAAGRQIVETHRIKQSRCVGPDTPGAVKGIDAKGDAFWVVTEFEEVAVPLEHYEPITTSVEEEYVEAEGTGKFVYGLRLDQFDRLVNEARWRVMQGTLKYTPLSSSK